MAGHSHHGHDHHDHTHLGDRDVKNIRVAFFLNLFFTIIEVAGGFYTNSIAILSDALHDLGDTMSLGIAWYFQKLSKKGRDKTYSYGYKRFTLLGAIINSTILIIGSIIILNEAIPRLANPQSPDAGGMIILAILGVIINGAAVLRLKSGESINERVVMLHLLEDVLGWVAVLIGAVVMYFYDAPIIDPILSLMIATLILFNVVKNIVRIFKIILQAVPKETDLELIREYFQKNPDIQDVHDLHIWTLDGNYNILTVHIVLENERNLSELRTLKKEVRKDLRDLGVNHATLEIELSKEDCEFEE